MAVVRKDPDADATTDVDAAMTMAADADFPTGEMAPADATFCGSLFFFAHAAETVSDATTDAATATAAGSLSYCFCCAAMAADVDADNHRLLAEGPLPLPF